MNAEAESPSLPLGWRSNKAALGGVDLRVAAQGRGGLAIGAAIPGVLAGWRTFVNWKITPSGSVIPWFGITLGLSLLAVWCALADELWQADRNCIVHRVGIGRWVHSREYRDADLQMVFRFTKWGVPYYRLYAIENGRSHFLIERDAKELRQPEAFISFHTG